MSRPLSMKSNSMCSRFAEPATSPKYRASWSGSTFASASRTASPRRHCVCWRSSVSSPKSLGGLGLSGSARSMTNGTASMRNPETPSCSQNAMVFLSSSRTSGLA